MADELVHVERGDDGVAVITLDNPKVNAISRELRRQLRQAAEALREDPPGAVVITGGERIFAAGADISEFGGADEAAAITAEFHAAFGAVAAIPRLVIAAVSGYALGGGCELALACDYRIASDRAVFGQPEILLGVIPGGGGTQRLARLVGPSRAKDLVLTGRQVRADEALRIGLCEEVVPPEQLHARARELAASLARGPLRAQSLAKQAIELGLDRALAGRPGPRTGAVRGGVPDRGQRHRCPQLPRERPRPGHLHRALTVGRSGCRSEPAAQVHPDRAGAGAVGVQIRAGLTSAPGPRGCGPGRGADRWVSWRVGRPGPAARMRPGCRRGPRRSRSTSGTASGRRPTTASPPRRCPC